MTERDLFIEALRLDPAERIALLDRECAGDPALRERVEKLLQAHDAAGGSPPPESTADYVGQLPGAVLAGKYKLIEPIGEGGMGEVWMALQTEPVRRSVAVKVIKAGMDSKHVLARFEAERQALALMDHPNIAKVLDAGLTDDKRPFFVMELVKGVPITKFCDERRLTPQQRLELFVPVCQAIQHAHQKGIIHRDIKPSNVLVALYDDKPVPKVIDFGVAKATGQQLTEHTLATGFGAVVGTPEYMSPEQAGFNQLDVDTRSDVYSLGVLLYELLAGSPPFTRKDLEKAGMMEMLRVIREQEPSKPSTKLSTAEKLPSLAAQRGIEPKKLTALLRGELDWIVMKALEKDRTRRYETANGFAADVRRYLEGEPVQAVPPSAGYRMKKFVRKNKGAVIAAGLIFAALSAGLATTLWQSHLKELARLNAVTAAEREAEERMKAVAAQADAQAKAKEANDRREETEAVLKFVERRVFAAARPEGYGGLGHDVTLKRAIFDALPYVAGGFEGRPLIEARLRTSLATAFERLGDYARAEEQHHGAHKLRTAAYGLVHPDALRSVQDIITVRNVAGRYSEALALAEENYRLCQSQLGPDHAHTLTFMAAVAAGKRQTGRKADALDLTEKALRLCQDKLGPSHPTTLQCMHQLGLCYGDSGRFEEKLALYEKLVAAERAKYGRFNTALFNNVHNLVGCYLELGRIDDAVLLSESTLKEAQEVLGREDRDALAWTTNLASLYARVGRNGDAVVLGEQALRLFRVRLGPDHPDTLSVMYNLGNDYEATGQHAEALRLREETLPLRKVRLGPSHSQTLWSYHELARSYSRAGRLDDAARLLDEAIGHAARNRDADPQVFSNLFGRRIEVYTSLGQTDLCLATAEQWEMLGRADADSLYNAACLRALCATALRERDGVEADRQCERALKWLRQAAAAGYTDVAHLRRDSDLAQLRDRAEFKRLANEITAANRERELAARGGRLLGERKWSQAEAALQECLVLREGRQPEAWTTYNTRSMLGAALAGQGRYAEAEPLLLDGCAGMKAREAQIPATAKPRLTEAVERLVQLYDATNKPADAAKWRAELEALKPAKSEEKRP